MKIATKFEQVVTNARENGFRRIVVRRAGRSDIVFYGAPIARAHLDPAEDSQFAWDEERWTDMSLFVLRSGRFAVVRERLGDLRNVSREAVVCTQGKLGATLGSSNLAKLLCELAGFDACEWLEEGESAAEQARPPAASAPGMSATEPSPSEPPDLRPRAPLCDPAQLDGRIKKLGSLDGEGNDRVRALLETVRERGLMRPLAQARKEMLDALAALSGRFPNLAPVVEFVRRQVRLVLRTPRRVLRLPPTLLLGDPGTGKTRLLEELARILAVDFVVIDCGVLTANFVIAGGDQSWRGAKAGRIFETLAEGSTLTPLIVLDELDKICGERAYDPFGPLHTLLERHSARRFSDEYVKLPVNASYVSWFATANRAEAIPESILSRLKRFDVRPPKGAEMAAVARSVYADLAGDEELAGVFSPELPAATVAALSAMTPRALREALAEAMARASWESATGADGRLVVLPAHIAAAASQKAPRRPIGFAAR